MADGDELTAMMLNPAKLSDLLTLGKEHNEEIQIETESERKANRRFAGARGSAATRKQVGA